MPDIKLLSGETVLIDTVGDIGKRIGFAKGRVVLTDRRLLLRPDGLNLDRSASDVVLADISGVETFNIMGLLPWGLLLRCHDGRVQKLRVMGRDRIAEAIRRGASLQQTQ